MHVQQLVDDYNIVVFSHIKGSTFQILYLESAAFNSFSDQVIPLKDLLSNILQKKRIKLQRCLWPCEEYTVHSRLSQVIFYK